MRVCKKIAIALLALAPIGTMAQDGTIVVRNTSRLITSTGRGEVRVKPDVITLSIGVQERGADVAGPRERAAKKVTAIVAALKSAGVKEAEIQTAQYNVSRVWEALDAQGQPTEYGGPQNKGHYVFQVTNAVAVRTGLLAKAGEILDAVVKAGANDIDGPTFGLKDGAPQAKEALTKAVKDAREKAETMADAADVRITGVDQIREQNTDIPGADMYAGNMVMKSRASFAVATSTPISAGEVVVSASVTVDFRFQ